MAYHTANLIEILSERNRITIYSYFFMVLIKMSKKLRRMGNASAGKREENIFQIFAYLNRRGDYNAFELLTKVPVSRKTLVSYLSDIQLAQFLDDDDYKDWVSRPFEQQTYGNVSGDQYHHALTQYESWQLLDKIVHQLSDEKKQQLRQYKFEDGYHAVETLFDRLESALLIFTWSKK